MSIGAKYKIKLRLGKKVSWDILLEGTALGFSRPQHNHSHVSFMLEHTLSVQDYSSSILVIPSHNVVSQASISSQDQKDH